MSEQDNTASMREEIEARVARFKATQEKFARDRAEFFATTLENARHSGSARRVGSQAILPEFGKYLDRLVPPGN